MTAIADRTLPNNLEAERAILGAVLLHNEALPVAVSRGLVPQAFFRDAHRRIFEKMLLVIGDGSVVDLVTLKDRLGRAGELDEIGGPVYISALVDGIPRSMNIEHYADIVLEKWRLREAIFAANALLARAYEDDQPSALVVEQGVHALLAIEPSSRREPVQISAAVTDYMMSLDQKDPIGVVPTGFTDLDEMLGGGLRRQELTIVAARPSVGKSAFALQVALHAARTGIPSVFFSIEMSTRALAARTTASEARIDLHRLSGRYLGERDYGKLTQAGAALQDVPLLIDDSSVTMLEIAAWCRRLRGREIGLGCAVIDYFQMLTPGHERSREQEVAAISRAAKRLAKDEDLAVIGVSQLSRAPEARSDKRPHLSDLRESGALEQDADVAVLLFRAEMYDKNEETAGIAELIVGKQRNGPTGTVKLVYIREFTRFENLAVS